MRGALFAVVLLVMAGCGRSVRQPSPVLAVSAEHIGAKIDMTTKVSSREREKVLERVDRSVKVTVNDSGDTLRTDTQLIYARDRSLERVNDSLRSVIDSLRSVKVDSVPVPYPVERELSRWERTKIDYGGFAIAAIGAVICAAVAWLAGRIKKK